MSTENLTQRIDMPTVFPFKELLQHYAQTGRTGVFTLNKDGNQAELYLMTGFVVHCTTAHASGEHAFFVIASWDKPRYDWREGEAPSKFTMSATVEDLLLQSLQGGVPRSARTTSTIPGFAPVSPEVHLQKTRELPSNTLYTFTLDISSNELEPWQFVMTTAQAKVGRSTDNDLVLPDTSLSRRHALLVAQNDTLLVRDLGSMNGTLIDGQRIVQGIAKNGQVIQFGEVICRVNLLAVPRLVTGAIAAKV